MSEVFEVTYGNDDGYAGGSRPHRFDIEADDLYLNMSDKDIADMFWDMMDDDFKNNHIHLYSDQESEFVKWAKEQLTKMKEEEEAYVR